MTNTSPGAAIVAGSRKKPPPLRSSAPDAQPALTLQQRVQTLVRKLLATHVNALQALMAEAGVAEAEQGWRLDRLVRGLREVQFQAQLTQNGRPLALQIDAQATPPLITLNSTLVADIEDAEILRALHAPIAEILGISTVGVSLVMTCHDERQLKQLINQVTRRPGVNCLPLTRVGALVEQRVELFEARLKAVAERFGEVVFWLFVGHDDFVAAISEDHDSWPRWEQIQDTEYMRKLIVEVGDGLTACAQVPAANLLVELCWESLELSPTAFLRHTAQQLRAHQSADNLRATLNAFCSILHGTSAEQAAQEASDAWPIFGDLNACWRALFLAEQRTLPGHPGAPTPPPIPVFEPAQHIFGLNEPSDLPWEVPLLAWTLREVEGLRDLLAGCSQTLQGAQAVQKMARFEPQLPRHAPREAALTVDQAPEKLRAQLLWRANELPADYATLRTRAFDACLAALTAQFRRLSDPDQQRVLRTLRAAYDGYFADARAVWARRFQAWKAWEAQRAFEVLSSEVSQVFGQAMLFDPFTAPTDDEIAFVPDFVLVAARPLHAPNISAHLPLAALRQTTRGATLRVRLVDVPTHAPCRWAGDVAFTMAMVEEHPLRVALDAIQNDSLRLLIDSADSP